MRFLSQTQISSLRCLAAVTAGVGDFDPRVLTRVRGRLAGLWAVRQSVGKYLVGDAVDFLLQVRIIRFRQFLANATKKS